jgi:threonine/homoserine/homoserine lactone efflux protein
MVGATALQYLHIVGAGLLISLSGSLPLGNLNVTAMQIAARENLRKALLFAVGVTVVEMAYLFFTLNIMHSLAGLDYVVRAFGLISVLVLTLMAAGSFLAARGKSRKNVLIDNRVNRVLLGAGMSALNPMQIPFWAGWALFLFTSAILPDRAAAYSLFTVSAGVGTFIALLIFAVAGGRFSTFLRSHERTVNICVGGLFLLLALIQLWKLL